MLPVSSFPPPPKDVFDDDDGWQDMPIIREDTSLSGMDEEDQRKYRYQAPASMIAKSAGNATGNLIDVDDMGNEWRSKLDRDESDYTRLRVNEEDDNDEVHLRTRYLFDEDKAMTPLSQMQATKNLLTEAQRIAYVGLCALTSREMVQSLKTVKRKELKASIANMELWALKIMGRLYYHMELETQGMSNLITMSFWFDSALRAENDRESRRPWCPRHRSRATIDDHPHCSKSGIRPRRSTQKGDERSTHGPRHCR
jgi:hypothetical protein